MNSAMAVVCREIFDENSQPSAEEISDYAQQLGIDPESESHLLSLAKDGLMQALPAPWKAFYDEKLETHYYYNEETRCTQWEHPLDHVYRELVQRTRDASTLDDTCASVQELLTSEEITKNVGKVEAKVDSADEYLSTDSSEENQGTNLREGTLSSQLGGARRLMPISGRPPLAPVQHPPMDRKLADLKISPLRRSIDSTFSLKPINKIMSETNTHINPLNPKAPLDRPKLFKQHSEIIDLKININHNSDNVNTTFIKPLKPEKGLSFTGKGSIFLKNKKFDMPSPDNEKSLPIESVTKSDPIKGILREKTFESPQRKQDSTPQGKVDNLGASSVPEEDKKSVRFKLEKSGTEATVSPGSNSSSEQNDAHSSIVSVSPALNFPTSLTGISSINAVPSSPSLSSMLLTSRPPLPPRPAAPSEETFQKIPPEQNLVISANDGQDGHGGSPRRRIIRPPATEYIKPDLFQKNFQKIADLVRPGDIEPNFLSLPDTTLDHQSRPRSPLIPLKNKIAINLMESIDSEASLESPEIEFGIPDLNFDMIGEKQESEDVPVVNYNSDEEKSDDKLYSKSVGYGINKEHSSNMKNSQHILSESDEENHKTNKKIVESKFPLKMTIKSHEIVPKDYAKSIDSILISSAPQYKSNSSAVNNLGVSTHKTNNSYNPSLSPRSDSFNVIKNYINPDNTLAVNRTKIIQPAVSVSQTLNTFSNNLTTVKKGDDGSTNSSEINNRRDELEAALHKTLEKMREEWTVKEIRLKSELEEELRKAEECFINEKSLRISEQEERHKSGIMDVMNQAQLAHDAALAAAKAEWETKLEKEREILKQQHNVAMDQLSEQYARVLAEKRTQLELENERALSEIKEELSAALSSERMRLTSENRESLEALRTDHSARVSELRADYRAEVERLRTQHACHLEELRARLASERATALRRGAPDTHALADKYRCLKEKYARLKHDVKMSIERRNKRRELSMTTGSETEKSNSHKTTQALDRCKELNEASTNAIIESNPRVQINNNPLMKYQNDNETSLSESNALKSLTENNNEEWRTRNERAAIASPEESSATHAPPNSHPPRRSTVAFREPQRRRHERDNAVTTDWQDSSDTATTADEKPKETINTHGRRRCFTRLKSASTSRLNYSPKRGEGWASPLEALRQQLRKLDDLEEQFPDLACQPSYSLRYPFTEIGTVAAANTPELEFVRHRALVEREGMRRARAVLRRRRAALRETRASLSPHRAPSEGTTSDASSGSDEAGAGTGGSLGTGDAVVSGAVLRSLKALHADVRDIWIALDARRPLTGSPETSACNNTPSTSQPHPVYATDPNTDVAASVVERARGLRAWLQSAP